MTYQEFLVAPFGTGLEKDVTPFLLPEDAFTTLENAIVFRGRVIKRNGFASIGRLKRTLTNETLPTSVQDWQFNVFTDLGLIVTEPNAQLVSGSITLVIDTETYTENSLGNLLSTPSGLTGLINYNTGDIVLTGNLFPSASTISIEYFPTLPVMGIKTRETPQTNEEETIIFDTKYAYKYLATGWEEYDTLGTKWSGSDSDFFWITNYRGITENDILFWVTNFYVNDPIRYLGSTGGWTDFSPDISTTIKLKQARIIVPYKDRLVFLNTIETSGAGDLTYQQRARWSAEGNVLDPDAFKETPGKGGYVDAPTGEAIISAYFVKDILVVFFERSTWELVFTGNRVLPFTWKRINSELGAESTFSYIPFDEGLIGIGGRGINTANPNGVKRIDEKIPDDVFKISNDRQGKQRVQGVRDFYNELVYWTMPINTNLIYPNKLLCYNYQNGTYSYFDGTFTALGHFQSKLEYSWASAPFIDWSSAHDTWDNPAYNDWFNHVCIGSQHGYISLFNTFDIPTETLAVKDISGSLITSPSHNLEDGAYIKFIIADDYNLPYEEVYQITRVTDDTFLIDGSANATPYQGEASIIVLYNINIKSKNFTPYANMSTDVHVSYLQLLLDRTSDGEVTFRISNQSNYGLEIAPLTGNNILPTNAEDSSAFVGAQDQIWQTTYRNLRASSFQVQITLNDEQMRDDDIRESDFQMHALMFAAQPTGRLRR